MLPSTLIYNHKGILAKARIKVTQRLETRGRSITKIDTKKMESRLLETKASPQRKH